MLKKEDLKIVFMGTPEFAVPVLQGLLDNYKVELNSYEQPLAEVIDSLNLGEKRYRIEELEKNMQQ